MPLKKRTWSTTLPGWIGHGNTSNIFRGTVEPPDPPDTEFQVLKNGTLSYPSRLFIVSDSTAFGAAATGTTPPKWSSSFPGQIRTALAQGYGNAGTGMVPANAVVRANPTWDPRFTFAGTITDIAAGFHKTCAWNIAAGGSISFTSRAKEFILYLFAESTGSATIQIDGGTARTIELVDGQSATVLQSANFHNGHAVFRLDAGTVGTHTLKVNCVTGNVRMWAVEALTGEGQIVVDNVSVSGKSLGTMGFINGSANDETNGLFGKPLLRTLMAQGNGAFMLGLYTNEWTGGTTETVLSQRIDDEIALVNTFPNHKKFFYIQPQPDPTLQGGTVTWTRMVEIIKAKAAAAGIPVLDNTKLFAAKATTYVEGNPYTEVQIYNMAASTTLHIDYMADNIHPNDDGSALIKESFLTFLGFNIDTSNPSYNYTETLVPHAFVSSSEMMVNAPTGLEFVPLQITAGASFYQNLMNTCNSYARRVVVDLPAGSRNVFDNFIAIGTSDLDSLYAFGFWKNYLAGFRCLTGDATVEIGPNAYRAGHITRIAALVTASGPLLAGLIRIDSTVAQPFFLAGITFRAARQQNVNTTAITGSDVPSVPQSAPHQGVVLYSDSNPAGVVTHCNFEGAGMGWTSLPPFEMANLTCQRGYVQVYHSNFDGRESAVFNAARPRKCGPIMWNNEKDSLMDYCYVHHTKTSRYAANDENQAGTAGKYTIMHTKFEQITNTQGDGKGGYTNATSIGHESSVADIMVRDCIISQDNLFTNKQVAQDYQLTAVNGKDPNAIASTKYTVIGNVHHNVWSQLEGIPCFRITASHWTRDNYARIYVYDYEGGPRKTAHVYTGTWPPTASYLQTNNVVPGGPYYLVRNS